MMIDQVVDTIAVRPGTDGVEVYAFLVGATVFKTGETEVLGLAGSIPVHLRHRPGSPRAIPTLAAPQPLTAAANRSRCPTRSSMPPMHEIAHLAHVGLRTPPVAGTP
jgi:hypothetical protein